jgi:hypothetical protein
MGNLPVYSTSVVPKKPVERRFAVSRCLEKLMERGALPDTGEGRSAVN